MVNVGRNLFSKCKEIKRRRGSKYVQPKYLYFSQNSKFWRQEVVNIEWVFPSPSTQVHRPVDENSEEDFCVAYETSAWDAENMEREGSEFAASSPIVFSLEEIPAVMAARLKVASQ